MIPNFLKPLQNVRNICDLWLLGTLGLALPRNWPFSRALYAHIVIRKENTRNKEVKERPTLALDRKGLPAVGKAPMKCALQGVLWEELGAATML